ncbi:MAG: carcinine hydrolase/isopenicillin-N N-acyltransferase family protein [bacterium]
MCTTFAKKIDNTWYLGKTRDPVSWMRWDDEIKLFAEAGDKFRKLLVQNPNPKEDGYYGGINEKGVAIVATYVKTAEEQVSYIRRPYVRLILDAATAEEAVEIIKKFNPLIGGNMFVADKKKCFGIEGGSKSIYVEEIKDQAVKTNHFLHLDEVNLNFSRLPKFKDWTEAHFDRATELLGAAKSLEGLENLLKDRQGSELKQAICTTSAEDECYTYSAVIFDTNKVIAHYAQGNPSEVPFKEYNFK